MFKISKSGAGSIKENFFKNVSDHPKALIEEDIKPAPQTVDADFAGTQSKSDGKQPVLPPASAKLVGTNTKTVS